MNRMGKLTDGRNVLLLAMVSCFLWGSATPAIKIGYEWFSIEQSDPWSIILFAGIRFFLAGVLVILFQSIMRRRFLYPPKQAIPAVLSLSMAQTVIQYLFFYIGIAHTSGVHGTILSGTGGFLSILLASLLFHYEKLTPAKIIGCLAGFAGIIVMNLSGESAGSLFAVSFLGEGFVMLSQLSYAFSGVMIKRFSSRFDVVMLSGWQFAAGGLIMIITGAACGGRIALTNRPEAWLLLVYMALISAVAYSIWGVLLKHNPVSRVSIYSFLTPLFGVLLSAVFLHEWEQAFSVKTLAALVLVCAGIYIVNRRSKKNNDACSQ